MGPWLSTALLVALAAEPELAPQAPAPAADPASGARVRFAWLDDGLAGLELPGNHRLTPIVVDDNGFTNGFELSAAIGGDRRWVSFDARMLSITERPARGVSPEGLRRWDSLDVSVGLARRGRAGAFTWTLEPRIGIALGGDLGGLALQSAFHRLTGYSSQTAGHGLQSLYDGPTRVGPTLAGGASAVLPLLPWAFAHGATSAQIAPGDTGIGRLSALLSLEAAHSFGEVRPSLSLSLEVAQSWTADPGLRIPGGYVVGRPFAMPGLTLGLSVGAFSLGWRMVLNESGTGFPNGAIFVAVGRRRGDPGEGLLGGPRESAGDPRPARSPSRTEPETDLQPLGPSADNTEPRPPSAGVGGAPATEGD